MQEFLSLGKVKEKAQIAPITRKVSLKCLGCWIPVIPAEKMQA